MHTYALEGIRFSDNKVVGCEWESDTLHRGELVGAYAALLDGHGEESTLEVDFMLLKDGFPVDMDTVDLDSLPA